MNALTDASSNIPHRFWLLSIFRSLGAGNPLLIAGPSAFAHYLDGVPQVALLASYLERHGWLAKVSDARSVPRYHLSEKGRAFWIEGERWWHQLSWLERCKIRLLG
ncbi:hypothetical protein ACFONG_18470 [Uliginosibacterium paludis]|uniref:PadR family transcriptional regulator n=1 Tax=Uliginosibacterium paludis TaxID=1615952 RepID=A0ABV2CTB1_9RHOO